MADFRDLNVIKEEVQERRSASLLSLDDHQDHRPS